jgi:hypothetical protein
VACGPFRISEALRHGVVWRRGSVSSQQRHSRLAHTYTTGRSARGMSRTTTRRRPCPTARTPQDRHHARSSVVSTARTNRRWRRRADEHRQRTQPARATPRRRYRRVPSGASCRCSRWTAASIARPLTAPADPLSLSPSADTPPRFNAESPCARRPERRACGLSSRPVTRVPCARHPDRASNHRSVGTAEAQIPVADVDGALVDCRTGKPSWSTRTWLTVAVLGLRAVRRLRDAQLGPGSVLPELSVVEQRYRAVTTSRMAWRTGSTVPSVLARITTTTPASR